jgi:hypothetical protein
MVEQITVSLAGHLEVVLAGTVEKIVEMKAALASLGNKFFRRFARNLRRQKGTSAASKRIVGNLSKERLHTGRLAAQAFQKFRVPIASN